VESYEQALAGVDVACATTYATVLGAALEQSVGREIKR